jgi:hypothetical protein
LLRLGKSDVVRLKLCPIAHQQVGLILGVSLSNCLCRREIEAIKIGEQVQVNTPAALCHGDHLINPQLGEGHIQQRSIRAGADKG